MRISSGDLTVLFNALSDRGEDRFTVAHPSSEIGDLLTVDLGPHDDCTVRFEHDRDEYGEARNELRREYPERVASDVPDPDEYVKAVLASGVAQIRNFEEVREFVERFGDPDLLAGHPPAFAGFDTNLLPWRIDRILGLRHPDEGVGYVNGFVLATGVRDELDWDYKCHDTDPFVDAFGGSYEEYWNQPLGSARIGRLGLLAYRNIRDIQQAREIECDEGDEAIVDAYDAYNQAERSEILLFSNDRTFVERAHAQTIRSRHVAFPRDLPGRTSATWQEVELLVYVLTVVFGVLELPGVTLHGVWRGKEEHDWLDERLKLDCRSPKIESMVERDLSIVESYEEHTEL